MALLDGTVVVVSGVGPDLGRSIVLRCAGAGADVVLAARTAARLDEARNTTASAISSGSGSARRSVVAAVSS